MGEISIKNRTLANLLLGAVVAVVTTVLMYFVIELMPNPGLVAGVLLIGIGIGLVITRWSRVGPFEGELGSPWFESDLCASLGREVARSARFQRELTIAVVRQRSGEPIDWQSQLRASDQMISCRSGWIVLVLPETNKDGVEALVSRLTFENHAEVQAVVMDPAAIHYKPERLSEALLRLVRNAPEASATPLVVRRDTDRLRWTS